MKIVRRRSDTKEKVIAMLKDIFKDHIGMKNAISSEALFFKVTGEDPTAVDYYVREYRWNSIKRVLSYLRKNGELFVVMGTAYHYVMNTEDELESYNNKIDATVKGLLAMKKKAAIWVESDELKKLGGSTKMKRLLKSVKRK